MPSRSAQAQISRRSRPRRCRRLATMTRRAAPSPTPGEHSADSARCASSSAAISGSRRSSCSRGRGRAPARVQPPSAPRRRPGDRALVRRRRPGRRPALASRRRSRRRWRATCCRASRTPSVGEVDVGQPVPSASSTCTESERQGDRSRVTSSCPAGPSAGGRPPPRLTRRARHGFFTPNHGGRREGDPGQPLDRCGTSVTLASGGSLGAPRTRSPPRGRLQDGGPSTRAAEVLDALARRVDGTPAEPVRQAAQGVRVLAEPGRSRPSPRPRRSRGRSAIRTPACRSPGGRTTRKVDLRSEDEHPKAQHHLAYGRT